MAIHHEAPACGGYLKLQHLTNNNGGICGQRQNN